MESNSDHQSDLASGNILRETTSFMLIMNRVSMANLNANTFILAIRSFRCHSG